MIVVTMDFMVNATNVYRTKGFNKGLRSGYMLAQSDNAGLYRYKKAMEAGFTKEQAEAYSREKGTKLPEPEKTEKKGKK